MSDTIKSENALIDIGVNLTHRSFEKTLISIVNRAKNANVLKLIITGISEHDSIKGINIYKDLSKNFPNMIYTTCGIHPHHAKEYNSESFNNLKEIASNKSVVAIGEIGLDFDRNISTPKEQEIAFENQLQLASELDLPVFLHERDAHKRQLEILSTYRSQLKNGVIHCFTGPERRGGELKNNVGNIPINRLMVETDAPYLLPNIIKKTSKNRINEPAFLPLVVEEIAKHRPESIIEISKKTTTNSTQFFNLI
jgi:TatD DNase family protein